MATKAFQKTYTQLEAITKATVSLKATGVSNDELALVDGRLAQVVKTKGDLVTLQIFRNRRHPYRCGSGIPRRSPYPQCER